MSENLKTYATVFAVGFILGSLFIQQAELKPVKERLADAERKVATLSVGAVRLGIIGHCSTHERISFVDECPERKVVHSPTTPAWTTGDGSSPSN
jgi:hypothetical protein